MTAPAAAGSPYESIVGELERVELAARERRLTAETEAERIGAAAAAAVTAIEAAVPERVTAALTAMRSGYLERAAAEVASIERELAARDEPAGSRTGGAGPNVDAAVELVVAAVLAEPAG